MKSILKIETPKKRLLAEKDMNDFGKDFSKLSLNDDEFTSPSLKQTLKYDKENKSSLSNINIKEEKITKSVEYPIEENNEDSLEEILVDNGPFWKDTSENYYFLKHENKNKKLIITPELYDYMIPYQRQGLCWLWSIHQKDNAGGILADEMGLGKTLQICAFVVCLFLSRLTTRVLIVLPVSLIENWKKELSKWITNKPRVKEFHGNSKTQRNEELNKVLKCGGICLTTYGMVLSNVDRLNTVTWDYVILDEGHKIKDHSSKTSVALRKIPSKHRIILTGTPIQNNLQEMWSLFDYTSQGRLLGDAKTFKKQFQDIILRGSHKTASVIEKQLSEEMASTLRNLIEPYFLRREKKQVFPTNSSDKNLKTNSDPLSNNGISSKLELKARKNDFVVWISISEVQHKIYSSFLETEEVKNVLNKTNSPLAAISVLKKICDHPLLLSSEMKTLQNSDILQVLPNTNKLSDIKTLINLSGKLVFLIKLLANLKEEGHRVLIFSQSTKMLDIIQTIISQKGYTFLRLDGTISNTKERQALINNFNEKTNEYFCFLLTTQVGGLGLNLTSADRSIIIDPSWNSIDDQAVDRIYRIGQTKNVVIYRLITCGTIEEKIYRKQVFKHSLVRTVLDQKSSHRYFTHQELKEVFILDDITVSTTQQQLEQLHSQHRVADAVLQKHIKFLHSLNICGISDHNLLFTDSGEELEIDSEIQSQIDEEKQRIIENSSLLLTPSTPTQNVGKKRLKKLADIENNSNNKTMMEEVLLQTSLSRPTCTHHSDSSFFQIHKCNCSLLASEKLQYNQCLQMANEEYRMNRLESALALYMEAVQICDEEFALHSKIIKLAKLLALF